MPRIGGGLVAEDDLTLGTGNVSAVMEERQVVRGGGGGGFGKESIDV